MEKINNLWVVDDDEIYRFAVNIIIDRSAIAKQTNYFNNGQLAIDAFNENLSTPDKLPDLILLDLNMPVLDGWQFLDAVGKLLPTVQKKVHIFLVSSSNDEEDFARAQSLSEVQDLIVKPLTPKVLAEILARIQTGPVIY
ncbi:Regulator of RpoS [Dyadobacter sp. CECT 9623]|uniref:Regulator of RpoS n=1 Tax=Dyadobacter linearis TaxID=2823330 RepID=A0ABN7R2L4_9BACT|nr:response regulator [Dyadobacter sp. CECT 9623]CAG5068173.1 Regulator of RpoS [Dyadobacter sp. CECT 9623]